MLCLAAAHGDWGSHWGAEDLRDIQLSRFISSTLPFFGFKCPLLIRFVMYTWFEYDSIASAYALKVKRVDMSLWVRRLCTRSCKVPFHVQLKNMYKDVWHTFVCRWVRVTYKCQGTSPILLNEPTYSESWLHTHRIFLSYILHWIFLTDHFYTTNNEAAYISQRLEKYKTTN